MIIRSSFKDYYDKALAHGHDSSRLFVRETSTITYTPKEWPYGRAFIDPLSAAHEAHLTYTQLLFFCGRAWPLWQFLPKKQNEVVIRPFCYFERAAEKGATYLLETTELRSKKEIKEQYVLLEQMRKVEDQFGGTRMGENILVGEDCPYLLLTCSTSRWSASIHLQRNPILENLRFDYVVPPHAAFQEIETFLGNQLVKEESIPPFVGGDEVIARQKGFDEMSFRTAAPGNKKLNRALNRARKKGPENKPK